jgi:hypothetical protein
MLVSKRLHDIGSGGKVEREAGNNRRHVMRNYFVLGLVLFLFCSCAELPPATKSGDRPAVSGILDSVRPACDNRNVMQTRTRQHYQDYYGTMMTTDPSTLTTSRTVYRWGIVNNAPLEMAYFAAYLKPQGRFNRFNAKIYIDSGIKAPMNFLFRNGDREGGVLKSVTVNPGQTVGLDFEIAGVKKMYVGSELRINHAKATRIVIGEPEFYNCR